MIRLASAAAVGCMLGGLLEGLLAGGGPSALFIAIALYALAWPVVFAGLCTLALLWSGPVVGAARRAESRAGALAGALLFGGGLFALRLAVERATAFFVGGFKDPALIAPASAVIAAGGALGLAIAGAALFGPLRRLLDRLAGRITTVACAAIALTLVALALAPPARELAKDLPPWPAVSLLVALVGAVAAYRALAGRPRTGGGLVIAAIGLVLFGPSLVDGRPDVEQALGDAHGLTGRLARAFAGPEPQILAPPPDLRASDDPAAGSTPPLVDEGPPIARDPLPDGLDRPYNVLVVTIDAVRADHLPLYGYARDTAPHLGALGARSAVFERAYTSINATRWLIQSLFTGRMMGDIDQIHAGYYVLLQPGSGHIFERLRHAGWHTEAHNSAHLRTAMWFGLEVGFDRYVGHEAAHLRSESADVLAGAFEKALDRHAADRPGQKWGMWLHLLEPHEPYRAHPGFAFGDSEIDRYDAEIAAADAGLGRMLKALADRGLAESTIVVVTSDHGEEFGEHGRKFHGKQLFEESIRVPLVIHVPGLAARRLEAPVSLIDVAPTIAHLTGLPPGRSPGLDGHRARSLVGVMAGGPEDAERAVFVDCILDPERYSGRQMAMVRGDDKLIVDMSGVDGRRARYYDLAADPGETTNLRWTDAARYAEAAAPLKAELARRRQNEKARMLARHVSATPPPGVPDPDRPPLKIAPGLELLGSRVDTMPWLDRRMPLVRTWYRVTAPQPDLILRHDYLDEAGRRLKRKDYRPLIGLHPTDEWRPGTVVEDLRMMRFRPAPRRYAQAMLSVVRGDRVIFGPHRLGELVPDARTVGRPAKATPEPPDDQGKPD